jgi:hypothetical protein
MAAAKPCDIFCRLGAFVLGVGVIALALQGHDHCRVEDVLAPLGAPTAAADPHAGHGH